MKKIFFEFITFFFLIITFLGCNEVDISKYKGDGTIIPLGRNFVSRGYKISFDSFNLNQPFSGKYQIIDLPNFDKTCWVGIEIISEDENIENYLKGTLSVKLMPIDGDTIFHCTAPLSNWKHSKVSFGENNYQYFFYFFKDENESSFKAKNLASLKNLLLIEYKPLSSVKNISAAIQLIVGGMK